MVTGGRLVTPLSTILEGMTREAVMDIAEKLGVPYREANISPFELMNADEVFFSTTGGGIIPVIEIDKREISNGRPGPITESVRQEYQRILESGEEGIAINYETAPTA